MHYERYVSNWILKTCCLVIVLLKEIDAHFLQSLMAGMSFDETTVHSRQRYFQYLYEMIVNQINQC